MPVLLPRHSQRDLICDEVELVVIVTNFLCQGDDGTSKEAVSTGKLNQENEHIYNLWCSGRVCCEGMLIQLKVSPARFLLVCCRWGIALNIESCDYILCSTPVSQEAGPAQCSGQDDEACL